jgi:hypothetical protein
MDPFVEILNVFFNPIIWGGALFIATIIALIELLRIAKRGGQNGTGPESDERIF